MNSVEENWQEMFDKNNNISPHKHLLFQHKVSLLLVEKEGGGVNTGWVSDREDFLGVRGATGGSPGWGRGRGEGFLLHWGLLHLL